MRARRGTAAACVTTGWYPVSTQDTPPVSLSTPKRTPEGIGAAACISRVGDRSIKSEPSAVPHSRGVGANVLALADGAGQCRAHMLTTRDVSHREMSPLNLTAPSNICAHVPANGSRRPALLVRRRAAPLQQSPPRGRLDT